jgi:hypothetical protein
MMKNRQTDSNQTSLNNGIARLDFERAHSKAVWREVVDQFLQRSSRLLPLDEVRRNLPLYGQHYLGIQQVPIEAIIGSEGRYNDFDRAFLPRQTQTRSRWESVDRAHLDDVPLPPIELYKVGPAYFVKDGNHRVSVAREKGQAFIDAVVVELEIALPVDPTQDLEQLIVDAERLHFEAETYLDELCPEQPIRLTSAGMYDVILEHIAVHRWYLGEQRSAEVPYPEAVVSWFENVYQPLVDVIREKNLLREFPQRTEADLYVWIIEHRGYLQAEYGEEVSLEQAAEHYASVYSERWRKKLVRYFKALWTKLSRRRSASTDAPGADDSSDDIPPAR